MGIALVDERTGTFCDFRRRQGVVSAQHLAPKNAPDWQRDPERYFNAVEEAENRSDSQIARDYRFPVPLGFDLQSAKQLAIAMGEALLGELESPVSVALHRDNQMDWFGVEKSAEKQGFHVHIYMACRGVTDTGMAKRKEGIFLELSNKNASGAVVERFNERWASLCNDLAIEQGLKPSSDHRSLSRMGIDREPQPTMSVSTCAMERRGIVTARGDDVRFHINSPTAAMNHKAAILDRRRETRPRANVPTISSGRAVTGRATCSTTGDRYGMEAIRQINEGLEMQEQARIGVEKICAEDSARREKWCRQLQLMNELDEKGFHMDVSQMNYDDLTSVDMLLSMEVETIRGWIHDNHSTEARRTNELCAAESKLKQAREIRDAWLRENPEPRFWGKAQWGESRAKAQEPVDQAKRRFILAMKRAAPEALELIRNERGNRLSRADEIKAEHDLVKSRLALLTPKPEPSKTCDLDAVTDENAFDLPERTSLAEWRKQKQQLKERKPRRHP